MKYLQDSEIETAAIAFLTKYHPSKDIPVPVEEIASFALGIRIQPINNLKSLKGIDGCISIDMKNLYIDEWQYMNIEPRARFTIAHELGHVALHAEYIKTIKLNSTQNWKFLVSENKKKWGSMEYQAYMFAGYILMPTAQLKLQIDTLLSTNGIEDELSKVNVGALSFNLAHELAKVFQVSETSARKRIETYLRQNSS